MAKVISLFLILGLIILVPVEQAAAGSDRELMNFGHGGG
jgi:hypothetical protein